MITIPIEELLREKKSIYKSVVLAAKRANELNLGLPALIKAGTTKLSTLALKEIRAGLVTYKIKGR